MTERREQLFWWSAVVALPAAVLFLIALICVIAVVNGTFAPPPSPAPHPTPTLGIHGDFENGIEDENTYLLSVHLDNGRVIRILPDGSLEFEGDLSEQAVEFWEVLAGGVPMFTAILCEAE